MLISLEFGGDFVDCVGRGSLKSDVNLLVEMGLKLSVLFHLDGFLFIEAIVLLVLSVDVLF